MSLASLIYEHAHTQRRQRRVTEQASYGTLDMLSRKREWPHVISDDSSRTSAERKRRRIDEASNGQNSEAVERDDASTSKQSTSLPQQQRQKYKPPPAASFWIPQLPGLSPDSTLTLYAGHLPSTVSSGDIAVDSSTQNANGQSYMPSGDGSTDGNPHLFFFMAKARHIAEREKLLLWFNGGPGCSSLDGALMEIGPLRMVLGKKGQLEEQPGAWNEYANVVFIDQPASTGYSFVSGSHFVTSGADAAAQVVTFLKNFFEVFPEYHKMDLYIGGESFAGIWIPYIARAILDTTIISPPLRGLLLGNPWIDPYSQYPAYVEFAYNSKLLTPKTPGAERVEAVLASCRKEMDRIGRDQFPINHGTCEGILSSITQTTLQVVNGQTYCVNNYDIRLTDTHPACGMNWPNLLADMYAYLPNQDTMTAFHANAKGSGWLECGGRVSDRFWGSTKPSIHLLPGLLEAGLQVMVFSGMQDLICNHVGSERMIENLQWLGNKGFRNQSQQLDWYVDGRKAGTWQTDRNLTYVQIYNASHMVPFDVPIVAADMFARFTATDYLLAAGASAGVPSRIGLEEESVIGETHPNGTAVDSTLGDKLSSPPQGQASTASTSTSPLGDAYYNIGAAVLILLVIGILGAFFIYRQRKQPRRGSVMLGDLSKGRSALLPTSSSHRSLEAHLSGTARGRSSMGQYDAAEETNELLPIQHKRSSIAHDRASLEDVPRGEALFAVGDEDDDEDSRSDAGVEGSDLGRSKS